MAAVSSGAIPMNDLVRTLPIGTVPGSIDPLVPTFSTAGVSSRR
jgi:hypothetical protein